MNRFGFRRNDLVTHNLLGATRPVKVRMTDADDAAASVYESEHPELRHDYLTRRLFRLQRALFRVLSPRYVAELGLVPGTADGASEARRYAVTLRRYVGKKLDPTPVFVVRGDDDRAPLAGYLDRLTMHWGAAGYSGRVTITLPEKALRRCSPRYARKERARHEAPKETLYCPQNTGN